MSHHVENPTFFLRKEDKQNDWYVVDATDKVLGRLASQVARILMGKHKPVYTPHVDCGDHVVVVNAEKVKITGRKLTQRVVYRYSGYPGGLKAMTYADYMSRYPERLLERVIKGMLPRTRLGRRMFRKLHVYRGPSHPHAAQRPKPLEIR